MAISPGGATRWRWDCFIADLPSVRRREGTPPPLRATAVRRALATPLLGGPATRTRPRRALLTSSAASGQLTARSSHARGIHHEVPAHRRNAVGAVVHVGVGGAALAAVALGAERDRFRRRGIEH